MGIWAFMIVEKRIKGFEKHAFGMFVHFGTYSVIGKELTFTQNDNEVNINTEKFEYGQDYVVRIAKIEV